jgi:hypothetical protein
MKRSIKELLGYSLHAKDGTKGTVRDFLFDEESWTIRYMRTGIGNMFVDKKVLIPRVFFGKPEQSKREFLIQMTKDEMKRSPKVEEHKPVSRKFEESLNQFYNIENYWSTSYAPSFGVPEMVVPQHHLKELPKTIKEPHVDSSLRSFQEVSGYLIECQDEKHGYMTDFIVEDENWKIVYIIIDIGNLFETDKRVMLAVNWINEIDYKDQKIAINQTSKVLEKAPPFDPSSPVNSEYEKNIYDYYGRKVIKV